MAASRTPARRRQRSVRVTVSVTLLSVATVAVLLALPTQKTLFLSISSVLALVLGWAALRITWTEVLQSRRENALDRAAAAGSYRALFTQRAAEHAEFTSAMTERLAESNISMRELEVALVASQRRTAEAEVRAQGFGRRVEELQETVNELEQAIVVRQAEEADALASWEAEGGPESLMGLMAWDKQAGDDLAEKISEATRKGA